METHLYFQNYVLIELKNTIKKDKKRKACKDCGELGHTNSLQLVCPLKINRDNQTKKKIKGHILLKDSLSYKNTDDILKDIALSLGISFNSCKSLYSEIPYEETLNRKTDISTYIKNLEIVNCFECNTLLFNTSNNSTMCWKGNCLCDICWHAHSKERDALWKEIKEYKEIKCCICDKQKISEGGRFHYDHLNMFDKVDSIFCMVNRGDDINVICNELNKCQILCVPCHNIVTELENRLGFTRIKTMLTKQFNNNELSKEEYNREQGKYQKIYYDKFIDIYRQLKKEIQNINKDNTRLQLNGTM